MKTLMRFLAVGLAVAAVQFAPSVCRAETYDADDTDYPLHYFWYPIHAVGKGIEYTVTRPIHWIVSQPKSRYIFGHVSNPRTDNYWGDWNQYQRQSY
jgi:hypothetical protein